jgi:hypothetical protein
MGDFSFEDDEQQRLGFYAELFAMSKKSSVSELT